MSFLFNILLVTAAFVMMECIAWFSHKYIMHGWGWKWHQDHHQRHDYTFEKNDLYALLFSLPAISMIFAGIFMEDCRFLLYLGIGTTFYGAAYFWFHDVVVHRRLKTRFKPQNSYLKRIINAHYIHHKTHTKEGAEAFGFLFALKKYKKK